MMTRAEIILCWIALPLGFSAAYIVVFISGNEFGDDPIYSYFYGFLAFLVVQLAIALWLSVNDDLRAGAAGSGASINRTFAYPFHNEGIWLTVRLSKDATDTLRELMSVQGDDQSEAMVVDRLLIMYQKTLRKRLLGDW